MLLDLPLEIIVKVLDYLLLEDQIQLAHVNQDLQSAFVYRSKQALKELNGCLYPEKTLPLLLRLCGSSVVHLFLSTESELNFELAAKYCTNVEKVHLSMEKKSVTAIKSILNKRSLRTIQLDRVIQGGLDNILQYINTDCQVLSLRNVSHDNLQHLPQLIRLEELKVNFRKYDQTDLFKICFTSKKLRILEICMCRMIEGGPDFVFPELEELQLNHCTLYPGLPTCVKLKSLKLRWNLYNDTVNIANSIAQCAPTLERLVFITRDNQPHQFTAHNLIELLGMCRTIQYISASADIIKDVFLENECSFVDVLKENGFNAERRFEFEVYGLLDKRDVENQVPNSEAWNFIKWTPQGELKWPI